MTRFTIVPPLTPRAAHSHKGTYGRVLIVAGSKGMSGAAVLCGSSALRSGAGLVAVACPPDVQGIVAYGNPCYMTAAIPQTVYARYDSTSATWLIELAEAKDVVAIGPGLGNRSDVAELLRALLASSPAQPMVIDADALNVLEPVMLRSRTLPAVLTPHPGEFARLIQKSTAEVQQDRERLAVEYALKHKVILVLKGHGTIVTDGERVYTNDTGNPGMATGGSGDVLTGCIAALQAQGLPPFEAAVRGVWSHGRAGDLVVERIGQVGLIATDLVDALPLTLRS